MILFKKLKKIFDRVINTFVMPRKNKNKRNKKDKIRGVPNTKIVDVGGGGDCFWRVVSHQLGRKPSNFMTIRNEVANYIETNSLNYQPFFETKDSLDKFISSIRKKGTWCEGEIEMNAVSILYSINIRILGNNGRETFIKTGSNTNFINMYHDIDVHFRSIIQN